MNQLKKTFTVDELPIIAEQVLASASVMSRDRAIVVSLSGDLGAGKTTLVQEIARSLGIKENVISPTFVIMKRYGIPDPLCPYDDLIHIDAHRLESSKQLLNLGWEELISNPKNLIIIEWPELVPECILEKGVLKVVLSHIDEQTRGISIESL